MAGRNESGDFEARLSAAERRIEEAAKDAAAARHLAAARDRDLADLTARVLATQQAIDGVSVRITGLEARITHLEGRMTRLEGRVDALTAAINNLSVQTGERFAQIDKRFAQIDQRFAEVDQRFDALETKFDKGFAELRGKLDQTAAGLDLIVKLLTPGEGPQ